MRKRMVEDGNLRVAMDSSRPHDHVTVLVDAPSTEGEPGAAHQLCIVRAVRATKKTDAYLGADSGVGLPACRRQVDRWG